MSENLKGDVQTAVSAWENQGITIADTVDPALRAFTQRVTEITRAVNQWTSEHPELTRALTLGALVIGGVLAALATLTLALATVLVPLAALKFAFGALGIKLLSPLGLLGRLAGLLGGALLGALKLVGRGLLMLGRLAMGHPILALVTLLAMAALYVWQHWEKFGPLFTAMWEAVKAAFGQAGAWIQQKWSGTVTWFKDTFNAVLAWLGSLGTRFTQFGIDLITGLANGIRSRLGAVKDAITNVANSTVSWFKEKLGIHSPSRVFMELGGWTMAGLDEGLRDGQQGPLATVLALGKRIVAAGAGIGLTGAALAAPPLDRSAPAAVCRAYHADGAGRTGTHHDPRARDARHGRAGPCAPGAADPAPRTGRAGRPRTLAPGRSRLRRPVHDDGARAVRVQPVDGTVPEPAAHPQLALREPRSRRQTAGAVIRGRGR